VHNDSICETKSYKDTCILNPTCRVPWRDATTVAYSADPTVLEVPPYLPLVTCHTLPETGGPLGLQRSPWRIPSESPPASPRRFARQAPSSCQSIRHKVFQPFVSPGQSVRLTQSRLDEVRPDTILLPDPFSSSKGSLNLMQKVSVQRIPLPDPILYRVTAL